MKSCRVCLNLDTTVSHLGDSEAVQHLQEILKNHGFEKLNSNHYVCFICKYMLNKYFSFMKRILRAQQAYKDIKDQTVRNVKFMNLDRSMLNLNLNLSCHSITNFYYGSKIEDHNDFVDNSIKEENSELLSDNPVMIHPLDTSINIINQSDNEENYKENKSINGESDVQNHCDLVKISIEEKNCDVLMDNPVILNPLDSSINTSLKKENCDVLLDNPVILNPLDTSINDKIQVDHEENNKEKENISVESDDDISIMVLKTQKFQIEDQIKKKKVSRSEKLIKKINVTKPKPQSKRRKEEESDQDYNPESESELSESSNEYYFTKGRIARRDHRTFPMECDDCYAIIESRKDQRRHYQLYHKDIEYPYSLKSNNYYVCQHCGATRKTIYHLEIHEKIHGEKNIECKECGKKFHSIQLLKRHSIYHKEPKFICDHCSKAFHHRSDLVLHVRTHTGEKPFKCHICGDGFAHKGNVGIHIRAKHQHAPRDPSKKPKKTGGKGNHKKIKTSNQRKVKKKSNLKALKKKSTKKHIKKKYE